jgi:hypothetical protein
MVLDRLKWVTIFDNQMKDLLLKVQDTDSGTVCADIWCWDRLCRAHDRLHLWSSVPGWAQPIGELPEAALSHSVTCKTCGIRPVQGRLFVCDTCPGSPVFLCSLCVDKHPSCDLQCYAKTPTRCKEVEVPRLRTHTPRARACAL